MNEQATCPAGGGATAAANIGAETGTATGTGRHIGHAPSIGNETGGQQGGKDNDRLASIYHKSAWGKRCRHQVTCTKFTGGVADTPKRRAGEPKGRAGARQRSAHGLAPRLGSSPRPRLA